MGKRGRRQQKKPHSQPSIQDPCPDPSLIQKLREIDDRHFPNTPDCYKGISLYRQFQRFPGKTGQLDIDLKAFEASFIDFMDRLNQALSQQCQDESPQAQQQGKGGQLGHQPQQHQALQQGQGDQLHHPQAQQQGQEVIALLTCVRRL